MKPEARPEVLTLPPPVHGAADVAELRRLGLRSDDVLDFSACINPYGPSPRVRAAIAQAAIDRYPDRTASELRRALAEIHAVTPTRILVGNGSSELILLAALAFVRAGDRVLVIGPTYSEYARAALTMGAEVTTWTARAEDSFQVDEDSVARQLAQLRPRVVFLCNPNNPTGVCVATETIASWARLVPETLFVVDEAYGAFAPDFESASTLSFANIVVLRSMTKDHVLAGLRLGYALGDEEVIAALAAAQPPWSVNALAQSAGLAALADQEHLRDTLTRLRSAKDDLVRGLTGLGWTVMPSAVHFFLVRVGDGAACRRALLPRGLLVRDAASFGLAEFVRIATRRPEDNERLLAAIGRPPTGLNEAPKG